MSATFTDQEVAERARQRLETLGGIQLPRLFESGFENNPAPDLALTNLERWLRSTSSPATHLEQLEQMPGAARLLLYILGASQPVADSIIQNPELAHLAIEPSFAPLSADVIVAEGRRLLDASSSTAHRMDRLRFLKQKWNLAIVVADLTGNWPQPQVWAALSDLADALIQLALNASWTDSGECPLGIIAFGKLAGHELNYSSDVDLVFITEDEAAPALAKLCDAFNRALSDRMGRGALYRVDLRLRAYGAAGPMLQTMTAVESYYLRYAEPWEVQALVRSRLVAGPANLTERWETMRRSTCFRATMSEMALEQMIGMRDRIERESDSGDLKRGPGGIRDVEFLTQILQLLHGYGNPPLQNPNTLEAVEALEQAGLLDHAIASSLSSGYTFLRKLEHRVQMVADQQTHKVHESHEARERLANLMGFGRWTSLQHELDAHRKTIHTLYRSTLGLEEERQDARSTVAKSMGSLGPSLLQWIDVIPESDAFYRALLENDGSLDRVRKVLSEGPRLISYFKESIELTELLFSGEIEEGNSSVARIRGLPADASPREVAAAYKRAYCMSTAQWMLASGGAPLDLSRLIDELTRHVAQRLMGMFDIIGLGSLGAREAGPNSDLDLLFLISDSALHREAEAQAQQFLTFMGELKRLGAPIEIDLRLRPDGGKGLLVRSYEGLAAYDLEGMEMWERFALGHARLIRGDQEALKRVQKSAYGLPLTPERLKELAKMKRRIETERIKPQHIRRNVKLGEGGLADIEWLVHLNQMRYPTALHAESGTDIAEAIRQMGKAGLLNSIEVDVLLKSRRHLLELRTRLFLLGQPEDRVPENPERLDRLAKSMRYKDGNHFLSHHEQIIDAVRRLYSEALERLRA
jgi:glutamate-ammonia-ligase adenylyltransferase